MKPEISPKELRQQIRASQWTTPTSGAASGYLQANLVMLPAQEAFNFLLFCVRNPKPCPILDVLEPGQIEPIIAAGADLRTDLPLYKVFENGEFKTDVEDVSDYFSNDLVSFLLGCSFSFENTPRGLHRGHQPPSRRCRALHLYRRLDGPRRARSLCPAGRGSGETQAALPATLGQPRRPAELSCRLSRGRAGRRGLRAGTDFT